MSVVRYGDIALRNAALVTGAASLACLAGVGVGLVGVAGFNPFWWSVLAVFFFFVTFFYRSAIAVEVVVGREGITKKQGLGLGWHADWASVQDLLVLPLTPRRLVVVSDDLSPRRGLNEWPVRKADLPKRARSVIAAPEVLDAVRNFSGRDITASQ